MRGTKTVMVRNNNIHSVRRRRASKQSKTLLRLQRAQFNLISKVHYYKHKREGEGKTQSKRDRERDRGGLDGKFEQREIFFGFFILWPDRACVGLRPKSSESSLQLQLRTIRNPQSAIFIRIGIRSCGMSLSLSSCSLHFAFHLTSCLQFPCCEIMLCLRLCLSLPLPLPGLR